MEQAGARSRRETSDIGSADDSLLDPIDRIQGLGHMAALQELQRIHNAVRLAKTSMLPRTAQERHRREFGHALRFGCCRDEPTSASDVDTSPGDLHRNPLHAIESPAA